MHLEMMKKFLTPYHSFRGERRYTTIAEYIQAAMQRATFEALIDGTIWADIPEFDGLWANARTLLRLS